MAKMSRTSSARSMSSSHRRVWRMEPQEEFIWAMRLHRATEDTSGDDDSTTESEEEAFIPEVREKSLSGSLPDYYSEKIQRQVQLFSSFLPDAALVDLNDYSVKEIECCMLYGRITGLHQLIEKNRNVKADFKLKLTTELNEFFGAIVQEILLNGGDIVKFSPSTIVAIWKCNRLSTMTQNVHIALDCTLVVQKSLSKFSLEAGEKVTVEFAITAGSVYFSLIGDDVCSTYLMCGTMYEDVRKARKEITVKNIIVAPNAIQYIHSFEYEIDQVEGYAFFQVIGLTAMWKQVRRADYQEVDLEGRLGQSSVSAVSLTGRGSFVARAGSTNEFYLRPVLMDVVDNPETFLENISKFCQTGIRAGILEDQPVENFVELRDVSIISIKIETSISKTYFMLDLTDQIFKIVSRFALQYLGHPDFVRTHDNKAFMSVTFGLRHCSHVMQQRSALKCAHKIMGSIRTKDKINTVSIGVSTGKVYYTMIGHPLRQELTMFGKTVATAINLATAFNGRIVCDQDTFLHSKMDADCFGSISKDQMHVVGEIHSASFYELMSDEMPQSDKIPIYDQPTIGRDKEISTFTTMLDNFAKNSHSSRKDSNVPSTLYIRAYPKEGKTRLLHEFVRLTPRDIPAHYIPLRHGNEDMPFFFIQKFFTLQFGNDLASLRPKEREKRLMESLTTLPNYDHIWALNPVFNVNFRLPENASKYSSDEKLEIISKILTFICRRMFNSIWVVAVDDVEYLDEQSWKILEDMHKFDLFFLVMTSNRDLSLRLSGRPIFAGNSKVTRIKIDALSPNYFGAIACQHFNVFICSSDLEYVLQKKSNGNIGYIKNLLTNLYHRGFIYVRELNINEISEENLIPQSLILLIPMPESRKKRIMNFIAKKGKYDTNEFKRILWYLFVESMQGSSFYDLRAKLYKVILKTDKIRVCFLKKSLAMSTMPEDLTISIRITQIFEMLTYPEQMILKCCSVLGDSFSRMVLEHVLTIDYYALLAPAVQSFFEMSILCCGRGDFTEGAQFTVIREKCVDPQFDEDLSCKCRAIFQERFRNIPDYAYCGFLRFKNPRFREIIYEQLRQSQKVDCHGKVIIFLHEETKRCRSCGRDAFNWDTKKRLDDYNEDLKKEWLGKKKARRAEREFDSLRTPMHDLFYEDKIPTGSMHKYSSIKTSSFLSLDLSIKTEMDPTAVDMDVYSVKKVFGPMHIMKASTNVSMVRTFSTIDFTFCECLQILSAYFRDMIIHCRGAGQHTKLYDNLQKYAYLCIYNRNISEAQTILKQAYPCINDIFEMAKAPPKWKKKLFEGKLSTISALAYMELGLFDDAIVEVRIAMKKFEIQWPESNIRKILNLVTEKIKRLLTFFAFPEINTKSLSTCICEYYVDVAEALNLYGKLMMIKKKWKSAELACSWALCKALSAQTDFSIICDCFCNMIMVSIHSKNLYMCDALQVHALRFCYRKTNRIESWELAAVCKMYFSIMIFKFIRSQVAFGIHLGYVIIKIGSCMNDTEKLLVVSTYLMTLLMSKLLLQEASSLLYEMEFCSEEMDDFRAQTWFHSQALFFHIETGYCIVPFQQCVNMFDINTRISDDSDFIDIYRRYGILMWLWFLRNEQWESASHFNEFIEQSTSTKTVLGKESIRSVISQLYIMEGRLLLLVNKLNKGNIWECQKLENSVKQMMKTLFLESKFFTWMIPRLLFLETYYYYIKNNEKKYKKYMAKTKEASAKYDSQMIQEWSNHNRKAWKKELTRKQRTFWRDHCEENNLFFFQQFDPNSDEIGFFTLPTPMFI
ncbi:hypothetical protein WA026_007906 [Henosepilachna vigintioctopunctata]|uniref:Adenylate cyclase type 10 n=1 Tax=Henosepilachna vigintioctopunctata TaxID=420089 RepID=A0AAW1TZ12_9CUCU